MLYPSKLDIRPSFPGHRRLLATPILLALLATSACQLSNTPAGASHTATAKTSRQAQAQPPESRASQPQVNQPPTGLSSDLAETYRKAQSGDARAMALLGRAYEEGEGAPRDLDQAVAWFRKSADAGDSYAMYRLGRICASGSGVPRDDKEALSWYRKAAAAGNTEAMYSVGRAYENGAGVREDVQRAVDWYEDAALRGNKEAETALERLGEGFDR